MPISEHFCGFSHIPLCIKICIRLWCLHAESNYELILTMDPLYHLTMEAITSDIIYL